MGMEHWVRSSRPGKVSDIGVTSYVQNDERWLLSKPVRIDVCYGLFSRGTIKELWNDPDSIRGAQEPVPSITNLAMEAVSYNLNSCCNILTERCGNRLESAQ